jgi:sigma-B regulation protein RsbU (phosphoserine phosphatase)
VLLVTLLALDGYVTRERDEAVKIVDGRLNPARVVLGNLLAAMIDQETGERGYLITGDEAFLGPYRDGQARGDASLRELDRLLAGHPDLLAGVDRVRSRIGAWRQLGAEYELDAKRAGRDAEAAALVATRTGMTLFERVRDELSDLQTNVRDELVRRQNHLEDLRRRLTEVLVASVVIGLLIVLLAGRLLARWITRPVTELGDAVRFVADGDLASPIKVGGPPDVADLGRDIEAMRERLLAEVDEARTARSALAKRGIVMLALRDELSPGPLDLNDRLEFATRFQPAEGVVAGDWFDVVHLGGDRLAIALMDVSGHGAEAAVFALKTKYLTLGALRNGLGPAEALSSLATQLGDTGESFVTGVIVEIDASSGAFRYASAGHPPMLVSSAGSVTTLGPTGPLLGPLAGTWDDAEIVVPPESTLTIYSDGLIEARGADGTEFGLERLVDLMAERTSQDSPESLVEACLSEVSRIQGVRRNDDITVVVVALGSRAHDGIGLALDVGGDLEPETIGDPKVQDETETGGVLHGHL